MPVTGRCTPFIRAEIKEYSPGHSCSYSSIDKGLEAIGAHGGRIIVCWWLHTLGCRPYLLNTRYAKQLVSCLMGPEGQTRLATQDPKPKNRAHQRHLKKT